MLDMTGYPSKGDDAEMPQAMLARKLRVLRAERGLSLRKASELTGVDIHTISDTEKGKHMPWDHTLAKLAKGYGVPIEDLLEEPALTGAPGKDEAPDTGPSVLAPWATYARRLAARTRSHTADPHSPAFRDAWAALFFVEECNRDAAELWGVLFEEELGWEAYADEPFAALNAMLAALEELAEALAEAQRRAEQMAAGIAESEIGQARRRAAEAAAQCEQAAARGSSRLERRSA
jgi:transcriptional regulator with XRE-family HTH domain